MIQICPNLYAHFHVLCLHEWTCMARNVINPLGKPIVTYAEGFMNIGGFEEIMTNGWTNKQTKRKLPNSYKDIMSYIFYNTLFLDLSEMCKKCHFFSFTRPL